MGALFRQPVLTCTTDELLQLLHARGLKLYGAALTDAAQDLRRVPLSPAAVAIGSEGRGLSAQLLAQCDGQIIIPMQPGAESLNAAVAAAVVMWEIAAPGCEEARKCRSCNTGFGCPCALACARR